MFFHLKISCKDKRILKKFLHFLIKIKFLPIFFKFFPKHEKRKFVTVLKSPHVNKTAQEQFEYRLYSEHLLIRSFKPFTFFLLLKKLKNLSFPGLNLKVKGLLGINKHQRHLLQLVSPDNIILKSVNSLNLRKKKLGKVHHKENCKSEFLFHKKYLQLFDIYGEIYLVKVFYS